MLRLKDITRANIVTVFIYLVVGIYLVEVSLLVLNIGQSRPSAAARLGIDFDSRTKIEVIEDLNAKRLDAVPAAHPVFY